MTTEEKIKDLQNQIYECTKRQLIQAIAISLLGGAYIILFISYLSK